MLTKRHGNLDINALSMKIYKPAQYKTFLKQIKEERDECNMSISFVNGCFDILHRGHLDLFSHASNLGDNLVVAINSDKSVKKLKGKYRPIIGEMERALMIAALFWVDYVIIFNDLDPIKLLNDIKPNFYVKANDWPFEKLLPNEQKAIIDHNIKYVTDPKTHNTTDLIEKILEIYSYEKGK